MSDRLARELNGVLDAVVTEKLRAQKSERRLSALVERVRVLNERILCLENQEPKEDEKPLAQIIIEIGHCSKLVVGHVIQIDERDRGKLEFQADNGVTISSDAMPAFYIGPAPDVGLRLQGYHKDRDAVAFTCRTDSIERAKEVVWLVKEAIWDLNESRGHGRSGAYGLGEYDEEETKR